MKKTFVTTLPDSAGSLLRATEIASLIGVNITRVSYNKSVDVHTAFFQVEGEEDKLDKIERELNKLGYMADTLNKSKVILLEFKLENRPGQLGVVLSLIKDYGFNISYITLDANGEYKPLKIGIYVDDDIKFFKFLGDAKTICPVEIIEYDNTEISYDTESFYSNYVDKLAKNAKLPLELKAKLAVNLNRVLQLLEERNLPAKTTFESMAKSVSHIMRYKGENFNPRITTYDIEKDYKIISIEPPSGSNTYIINYKGKYLFIDTGYSIYEEEMLKVFNSLGIDFNSIEKKVIITHADFDHAGLLYLFDEIYCSDKTKECFMLEWQNKKGFREQNPMHLPYIRTSKILTRYKSPNPDKITVIAHYDDSYDTTLYYSSNFMFGDTYYDIYCGQGGHLKGEIIIVDPKNKLVFPGDIFVNLKDFTLEQGEYNKFAQIFMSSVDTNQQLAKMERLDLLKMLTKGKWLIFGGHGRVREYIVE